MFRHTRVNLRTLRDSRDGAQYKAMLELHTKENLQESLSRWKHFWERSLLTRPVVLAAVRKEGAPVRDAEEHRGKRYWNALHGLWDEQARLFEAWLESTEFPGEMIPMASPDFGPDQWAAFYGADLTFKEEASSTNWVDPIVQGWAEALPLKLDENNAVLRRIICYSRWLSERGEGKFLVSQIDAHSNADALSALRGAQNFMTDLYDCPELISRAMMDIRKSYGRIHRLIAKAARMGGDKGYGHNGMWHKKSFQIVQSDVICMLSPEHFRKFVMPALEEEFACHDRSYFHLDGREALKHLDDILSIPGCWVLQWQPGAGQKPNWQWTEILLKAQKSGKAVHVFGKGLGVEAIKALHKQLDPARTMYSPELLSQAQAAELFKWLEAN